MFDVVFVVVVVSSIWVGLDARSKRIPIDKKPYSLNNGALAWFLTCLLLWIFGFPYYLVKRSKAVSSASPSPSAGTTPGVDDPTEQLRKLSQLMKEGIITQEDFEKKKRQLLGL